MMTDLTDDEAAKLTLDRVNALFAANRATVGDENTTYLARETSGPGHHRYDRWTFQSFCNGALLREGAESRKIDDMQQAIDDTVTAVAAMFPDHAQQQVIWRREPTVERVAATPASPRHHIDAIPAHFALYLRLVATPLGV